MRRIKGIRRFASGPDYAETWVDREKRCPSGDVAGRVKYHWELAGPNGAAFFLLVEAHHTDDEVRFAAAYLRAMHDVVRLYWVDMDLARRQAAKLKGDDP